MKHSYVIEYMVESSIGVCLKKGKIKVKRVRDAIDAQIRLEQMLKDRVPAFHRMIVLSPPTEVVDDDDALNFLKGFFWT